MTASAFAQGKAGRNARVKNNLDLRHPSRIFREAKVDLVAVGSNDDESTRSDVLVQEAREAFPDLRRVHVFLGADDRVDAPGAERSRVDVFGQEPVEDDGGEEACAARDEDDAIAQSVKDGRVRHSYLYVVGRKRSSGVARGKEEKGVHDKKSPEDAGQASPVPLTVGHVP